MLINKLDKRSLEGCKAFSRGNLAFIKGFSLLEMLLVMAIASAIMVALIGYTTQKGDEMRRDRAVMQVTQILNAGLAYYVSNSRWPTNMGELTNYLPSGIKNPWGQLFTVSSNAATGNFNVCTEVIGKTAYSSSTIIAGRLPFGVSIDGSPACPSSIPATSDCATSQNTRTSACTVEATVTIPGQNLNNARSINFAGLYHSGACVPAPSCPSGMTPTIMVVPVSISGIQDASNVAYPITSFTAHARGNSATPSVPSATPMVCGANGELWCGALMTGAPTGYWRVCADINTTQGHPTTFGTGTWMMNSAVILALTRCAPANENDPSISPNTASSDFTVFLPQ